ncbi:hypothetical protein ACFOTA_15285 [Chitinophaga sp. GCM10012297]|uniref:Lipoprotein n=1 Tax=Chitinophaga chungangae TaxID=2821488 RepID=A0ABS3YFX6_9BACT|nr:hypothetical protein [Chitinophaga chungangae]MBO9153583.1 hypothetical protein [Chitinophaga chungangae]
MRLPLLIFLTLAAACRQELKFEASDTGDARLDAYNDLLNEIVARRTYNIYLGEDEEKLFDLGIKDSAAARKEKVRLHNRLFGDTSRFWTLVLDTFRMPQLNDAETEQREYPDAAGRLFPLLDSISPDRQAVIDQLNTNMDEYPPAAFSLHTARTRPMEEARRRNEWIIGRLRLSRMVFNKRMDKALVFYEFKCGDLCGRKELLQLENKGKGWRITRSMSFAVY